jgi:hypothetical protein
MNVTVAAVSALLDTPALGGITRDSGVWRIDGTSEEIERLKAALLQTVCEHSSPFVHYDEAPPGEGLLASSEAAGPGVWHVPRGASGVQLLAWLYMGNWQLYLAESPMKPIPDLCRAKGSEVRAFLRNARVPLVIDSFHDDNHWTVGVSHDDA